MAKFLLFWCFWLAIVVIGCKEAFMPDLPDTNNNILVVDGYINTGGGKTEIKLSKTAGLKFPKPELNASVMIEGENNIKIGLQSEGKGLYSVTTQPLDMQSRYRLRIKTSGGREYVSDFVEARENPDIDSINYKLDAESLNIFADTHNPSNNTRYYRWEYQEVWEINSYYTSDVEFKNNKLVMRDPNINIYRCWDTLLSAQIITGSTVQLSRDITHQLLLQIPVNSEKISKLYSILVTQYGQTQKEFEYFLNMKKNTEQLGSIFDPQPSEIRGNIHCISDDKEVIIGYIGAGVVRKQRIFIDRRNLPLKSWFSVIGNKCSATKISTNPDTLYLSSVTGNMFTDWDQFSNKITAAPAECIDCRLKGSNIKPDFWPN